MELLILIVVVVVSWLISKGRDDPRETPPRKHTHIAPKFRLATQARQRHPVQARATPQHSAINAPVLCGRPYVKDGDSLVIQKTEIRLFGVDAPELNHPYGKQAKWALHGLCKGHDVRAECVETDDHGRTVAKCTLPDGRDLSAEMVKLGLAIDWPKFSGGKYRSLEPPDARKKMWLADARQKGRMHVWEKFAAGQRRTGPQAK